jgi:predicted ATPase/DNA-binding CsgD family transcriptional regulator
LPLPPSPLLGREGEVGRVIALLDQDDLRLVTLLGPGGVGKTRLGLEVARQIAPDFADGAVFVPLETVREPDAIPGAVARAFGVQDAFGWPIDDLLAELLAGRHLLLVLDNFEQVVAGAPWVAALLADNPRLKALVTSRTPLNVGGEQQFHVPTLPVPVEDGERTAAVDLFVQRARALRPDFSPDSTTLGVIAEVCRRLDGLPLAIELAAARVQVLSPAALLARLTDRLSLLTGSRRDAPARLRTMRDAIGWSYDLLGVEEQRAFRRLAVCVGGFSSEASAFVVAWPDPPLGETEALVLLQSLVDQSLVQPMYGVTEDRFRMLETIREFGLQMSADGEDFHADRRAHAEYFIDLARRAQPEMIGPDLPRWLDRLEDEYPNLLAAMDWLEANDRLADAIGILSEIAYFLLVRGNVVDDFARVERWLEQPALRERGHARGLALQMLGGRLENTGDTASARLAFEEAVELLHEAGDRWHEAQALTMLAGVCRELDDHALSGLYLASALEAARAAGNHRLVSINLNNLAGNAEEAGDAERARALREEAVAVARDGGDLWARGFHLCHLAGQALADGDLEAAERLAEEARRLLESYRSKRELPGMLELLARIARARGDLDAAAEHIAAGLAIAERGGYAAKVSALSLTAGIIATERGDIPGAAGALSAMLRRLDPAQQAADVSLALDAWAWLAARVGDSDRAARFHGAAVRALRDAGLEDPLPFDTDIIHLRESLRTTLGKGWTARAEAEGAAVPIEMAVAEALSWAPPALVRVPSSGNDGLPFGLSPRELEVLRLLTDGMSNQRIADELYVSRRTVTTHVESILGKLGVRSRTSAVSFAIRNGLA